MKTIPWSAFAVRGFIKRSFYEPYIYERKLGLIVLDLTLSPITFEHDCSTTYLSYFNVGPIKRTERDCQAEQNENMTNYRAVEVMKFKNVSNFNSTHQKVNLVLFTDARIEKPPVDKY